MYTTVTIKLLFSFALVWTYMQVSDCTSFCINPLLISVREKENVGFCLDKKRRLPSARQGFMVCGPINSLHFFQVASKYGPDRVVQKKKKYGPEPLLVLEDTNLMDRAESLSEMTH